MSMSNKKIKFWLNKYIFTLEFILLKFLWVFILINVKLNKDRF
jgi:hypothetical protein